MATGPLQLLVVNYEDPDFNGEVADELERLEAAGIVRVLDLAFVSKSRDGEIDAGMTRQLRSGAIVPLLLGLDVRPAPDEPDGELDLWYAADAIEPGCAAFVVVLEHLWAIPLRDGVMRTGGRSAKSKWLEESDLAPLGVTPAQ